MATKLVPIPAGIPGKQLDIFDEIVNRQEDRQQQPSKSEPERQHPDTRNQPLKRGTFQAFRL